MKKNKTILLTGATGGIGRALAVLYAAPDTTLFLTGRNAGRLQEVEKLCRQKGATVITAPINVTDRAVLEKQILDWDRQSPIDIVIANAGVSGGTSMDAKQTETQLREIIDTNINGTFR
jgi:NADP-dependent 3-hydroxy acid dehydrogenase YdfG